MISIIFCVPIILVDASGHFWGNLCGAWNAKHVNPLPTNFNYSATKGGDEIIHSNLTRPRE